MKIKNPLRFAALLVIAALLLLSAAAASWEEMYENGVVSDGNVRFGDARDGVVSDVSEPMAGEAQRIRNGFDEPLTDGGNDNATGSVSGDDFGLNDDNILLGRNGAESGNAADDDAMPAAETGGSAGMAFGILLAVLVIIAVVVLVMLFMPKRRG